MPKVVHLNTYDGNGGAGKACLRLNDALLAESIDSKVIVHYKFGKNPAIRSFDTTFAQKYFTAAKIIGERLLGRRYLKPGLRTPFSFAWFGRDVTKHPDIKKADIIHLHWVNHSFLNPRSFIKLAKLNKPVVWTFHDSNAFTGGCHVRYNCDHFQHSCGFCPLLENPDADDISNKTWNQKDSAYQQFNFTVISPSSWMLKSVRESSLMQGRIVKQIPNTLDTEIFKPLNRNKVRAELGLDPDKTYFLSGFMPSRKDLHKGTDYLIKSLYKLAHDNEVNTTNLELLVFGNRDNTNLPSLPFPATFLGTINDEIKLAQYYAACDAFLIPSLEDNLPYTVMESLACGTPVIAFTTGGIPDMVKHKINGYLAKYKSAESFCMGMSWFIEDADREKLRKNARETVMQQFAETTVAKQHIDLYQEVIKAHKFI